jgi:hypothetical protein
VTTLPLPRLLLIPVTRAFRHPVPLAFVVNEYDRTTKVDVIGKEAKTARKGECRVLFIRPFGWASLPNSGGLPFYTTRVRRNDPSSAKVVTSPPGMTTRIDSFHWPSYAFVKLGPCHNDIPFPRMIRAIVSKNGSRARRSSPSTNSRVFELPAIVLRMPGPNIGHISLGSFSKQS